MALADAVKGSKRPSQLITWLDGDGDPIDLSDVSQITARIEAVDGATAARDATGSFTVTTAASGIFRWDYGTADVATAGKFYVQFTATFGGSPTPALSKLEVWEVLDSI